MLYREFRPTPRCASFVECYWHLQSRSDGDWESIYPDGCAELVFKLSAPAVELRDGEVLQQPRYFVYGQIDRRLQVRSASENEVVAIRLRPWGASALLQVPGALVAGRALPLDAVAPELARRLVAVVETGGAVEEKVARLDGCLERWISARSLLVPPVARLARHLQQRPTATVDDIARLTGWGARTVQRRFRDDIGLSAKRFLQINRFLRFKRLLESEPRVPLSQLAVAAGYYDQSHLHRDLRRFTGETPAAYRERSEQPFDSLYGRERLERLVGL